MRLLTTLTLLSLGLNASLLDFNILNQAKEAYENKEYKKAERLYGEVENDEARFNQADALYRAKDYNKSLEMYKNISDPKLQAQKLHNMGNAYAQMNKIDEGIKAYEEALSIKEDEDTKYNLELLKKKKKEEEKKDKENKKDDKKKDDKNKKNDKENKNNKKDQDKKSDAEKKKEEQKKRDEEKKKKEQEEKDKAKKKNDDKKDKKDEKEKEPKMGDMNKTQPPISNMEERKWQKMLNKKGVNTLMLPLNPKGEKRNAINPW